MKAIDIKRAAILAHHQAGKTNGEIFELLQNTGVGRQLIWRVVTRYLKTGSVKQRSSGGRPRSVRTPAMLKALKEQLQREPDRSQWKLAFQMGTSIKTIRRALKQDLGPEGLKKTTSDMPTVAQKEVRVKVTAVRSMKPSKSKHFDKVHGGAGTVSAISSPPPSPSSGGCPSPQPILPDDTEPAPEVAMMAKDEVPLDSGGCCFICLTKLEGRRSESSGSAEEEQQPLSISPDQYLSLSRYLEPDIRRVLREHGRRPSPSYKRGDLMRGCQLKVSLCQQCSSVNQQFLELYRQLKKIELEVTSCLKVIHDKMSGAEQVQKSVKGGEELKLAKGMRKEVMRKCSSKLRSIRQNPPPKTMRFSATAQHSRGTEAPPGNDSDDDEGSDCAEEASDMDMEEEGKPGIKMEPESEDDSDGNEDAGSTTSKSPSSHVKLSPQPTSDDDADVGSNDDSNLEDDSDPDPEPSSNHGNEKLEEGMVWTPRLPKQHICHICGKGFYNPNSFWRHANEVHRDQRTILCDLCGKAFKSCLRSHKLIHEEEARPPPNCQICGKEFSRKRSRTQHMKRCHKEEGSKVSIPSTSAT